MEIKGASVNIDGRIQRNLQKGKKLAEEIMLFADKNSSAVSKSEFQEKLNKMKNLSTEGLVKFIRSFDKDESVIELIVDEVGSSKEERKDACKKVLTALTNKAKELGIDTKDFEKQFVKELDYQFNSWGLVNTEKLDKIINALTQSIENRQNFTAEDVEAVQNTPAEAGQEQANNIIENRLEKAYSAFGERVGDDGKMTDKHEVQVPILDKNGNPTGKFETKLETYNGQMQRDGIAADIADGVSRIWGSENTAVKVRKDLKATNEQLKQLEEAKLQGESAYKAKFKEIFGVEYDYANVLAYQKAESIYVNTSVNHEIEKSFNEKFKTLLSSDKLKEEKSSYTSPSTGVAISTVTATKEDVYNREFNNLATFLSQEDADGNVIDGTEFLNNVMEEYGVANGTLEEKFKVLKTLAKQVSKELHSVTLNASGGKEFSEVQAMYDNSYKAAYGVENDIMKRVTDYNVSQEKGAQMVKAGTKLAISLGAAFSGLGLVGVAAWTAGGTVATEVVDRGTSGNALNALREQGVGEYLNTVGKDVDWGAVFKEAAMSGGAVLIGGGVAQGVTAVMKGSSSVAQFAAMLGADVITDATMEFFTTKQITWQGLVFTVLLSTIGNAVQLKQMKNSVDTTPTKPKSVDVTPTNNKANIGVSAKKKRYVLGDQPSASASRATAQSDAGNGVSAKKKRYVLGDQPSSSASRATAQSDAGIEVSAKKKPSFGLVDENPVAKSQVKPQAEVAPDVHTSSASFDARVRGNAETPVKPAKKQILIESPRSKMSKEKPVSARKPVEPVSAELPKSNPQPVPVEKMNIKEVYGEMDKLYAQMSSMRSGVEVDFDNQIQAAQSQLEGLESGRAAYIESSRAEINNCSDEIGNLSRKEIDIKNDLKLLKSRHGKVEQNVIEYRSALYDLEKQLEVYKSSYGVRGNTVGELHNHATATRKRFIGAEMNGNLTETVVPDNAPSYYYNEDIGDLYHQYNITTSAQNKESVVKELRAKLASLEDRLENVNRKIANQEQALSSTQAQQQRVYDRRNSLSAERDAFVEDFNAQKQNIKQSIENLKQAKNNALNAMMETPAYQKLNAFWKQLQVRARELS